MGYDRKYGRVTFERGTIGDDEPVFVVRACDAAAPAALRAYAHVAAQHGGNEEMVRRVLERAEQVARWQAEHPELVHPPDTVPGQIRDSCDVGCRGDLPR